MSRAMRIVSVVCLCLGLVSAAPVSAQTGLATLTGIVTDNSGGAVPGVTVTATNQATNVNYTGVTNDAGSYVITSVPIAGYVVKVELSGFKGVQSTVQLSAAQTARVDFKLEVGGVQEQIEVVATSAVLQTENAVVGQTMQRDQVEKLPVQGRNLSTAALFTAGVTTPNPGSFNSLKNTGGGRPYVNGQREQANNFMLDGVDMNDAIDNLIAYQPSPDAVEQVSVETNNYSPELGNVAGAIVNMVIKSGTNRIRGNGFYYWRDNELAATPWATNRAGGRKSDFNRKIFGGTAGGPIVKNKLFFFGDYQGGRQKSPPADSFTTVFPDAWRNGDLSSLLAASTPIVVYDPQTGQPFPNNQIPVSRFSQFARNLLANEALYPRANVSRPLSDFRNNYLGKSASREKTNQFDVKVDWNASNSDKVYVRYSKQTHESLTEQTAMPLLYGGFGENPFWSVGANWNRIIGTGIVNDLLVGYNDNSFNNAPLDLRGLGPLNNQLGLGGSQPIPGLTEVRIGNNVANIGTTGGASNTNNGLFQINERLTWLKGRHTMKFGASWNYYVMERYYAGNNGVLGYIAYGGAYTRAPNASTGGAAVADFLLDQVSGKGRGSLSEPWTHLQSRTAVYAADDFKATDDLTLNLGSALGLHLAARRKGRSPGQLLAGERRAAAGRPERQQPGALRAVLQGLGAASRLRVSPERPLGGPRRLRHHAIHGRHRRQPAPAAEPAVLLRVADRLRAARAGQHHRHRLRGAAGAGPAIRPAPRLGSEPAAAVHPAVERLRRVPAGLALVDQCRLCRQQVEIPGDADRGQPAAARHRPGEHLAADSGATPALRLQSADHQHQHHRLARPRRLQGAADDVQAAAVEGSRLRGQLHAERGQLQQPRLLRLGRRRLRGRLPGQQQRHRGQLRPGVLRREAHLLAGRQLRAAVREGSGVRQQLEPRPRCSRRRLGRRALPSPRTAAIRSPSRTARTRRCRRRARRSWPDLIGDPVPADQSLTRWLNRDAFRSAALGTFGNAGVGIVRAPGYWNVDLSLSKRIATVAQHYLMFRVEAFNLLNHPNFGPPDRNIQSQTFGTITSTAGDARVVQLALKYSF